MPRANASDRCRSRSSRPMLGAHLDSPTVQRGGHRQAARRASRPTCTRSGCSRARSCPEAFRSICRAPATSGTAFKKLTLLRPERHRNGCWSSGSASAGSWTRSDCGWPPRWRSTEAGRYEARSLAWALPEAAARPSARPKRGPRPWSRARCWPRTGSTASSRAIPTTRRRPGSSAWCWPAPATRRRPSTARRRRGSRPRPPTARASSRACPSNVVTPSYLAERAREIAAAHDADHRRRPRPRRDRAPRDGRAGRRRQGQRRGAAADRAALRGREARARRSGSSARP